MKATKKRIFGILLSLALVLGMMPAFSMPAHATPLEYPLWVGGTQVTSANAGDVLANDPVNAGKVSYTPETNTLTLKGANITTGYTYGDYVCGVYYGGSDPLSIVLADGSKNTIKKEGEGGLDCGIYIDDTQDDPAGLAISGKGELTVSGKVEGIYADYSNVSISGSTVTASGSRDGIYADKDISISGSTVTASGSDDDGIYADFGKVNISDSTVIANASDDGIYANEDISISGSTVTAEGRSYGINADECNVNISDGTVVAAGDYYGIKADKNVTIDGGSIKAEGRIGISGELVTINDGTVNATGTESEGGHHPTGMGTMALGEPCGIEAMEEVVIKGGKVTAAGDGYGILGTVKNHITGTGWSDKAGTAGKTDIAINTEGQDLKSYKKVQFPAKVDPEPTPAKISGTLMAKMTAKGKKALAISWNKIQGADGYDVFFTKCNSNDKKNACKLVASIKGDKTFKWIRSGLKKNKSYKACVKAYVMTNGKKTYVKTSPLVHAYTGNSAKIYTNAKSMSVNKTKVTLNKGKTFKIKTRIKNVKRGKKLMPKKHVATLRYKTTDSAVAAVAKSGKIIAKGKGTCTVTVFAHNGVSKQIKVTVK